MSRPKTITVRPFDLEKDLQTILNFHEEHIGINFPGTKFMPEVFSQQLLVGMQKQSEGMFVWEEQGGRVVGFLWLEVLEDIYKEVLYGQVRYLHVDKDFRGNGLGKEMMMRTDDYFSKLQVAEVRLGTHVDNKAALSLYERSGYKPYRVTMVKEMGVDDE